jgi:hypothetical protein
MLEQHQGIAKHSLTDSVQVGAVSLSHFSVPRHIVYGNDSEYAVCVGIEVVIKFLLDALHLTSSKRPPEKPGPSSGHGAGAQFKDGAWDSRGAPAFRQDQTAAGDHCLTMVGL